MATSGQRTFKRNAHINYFLRCLGALPASAEGHDSNRITIAYFCLSGLDLLGALEKKTTEEQRKGWVEWIWSLQAPEGGFRGSTYMTTSNPETSPGHLPSTYTALLCLAILRAPLDRLNRPGLKAFLRRCQAPDGSFSPLPRTSSSHTTDFQSDLRMTYCAVVIADILKDVSAFDRSSCISFMNQCRTWEGAYASRAGVTEAQGGTTYCAVASLSLLQPDTPNREDTIRWSTQRQLGGFQGRPGKLQDVCYSFWIGAALGILGQPDLLDSTLNTAFLLSAQSPLGGFGKEPDDYPDPYHSYLALAALALTPDPDLDLKPLDARWNISRDTADWLREEIREQSLDT
ncbi:terpenoid cyclases/protein prenyltransferase alpha-alpha toroid [Dioszegia hungarica]|uniref:Terpenoid cyclases/protein prenyltransferase alpha-alpha toroid n=1 Tax=Dioszegia hungarica TaxID=4972 RepID=A0AA38H3K3_9TREE|nr:terpenoid cyclases/protein prenyltransferase alpha-alpha toroid [Dioszegia hungarica]KAI9632119.1 terpenoid cyclases/protein prenyltransferase alpha-alpha toroid [Dioszegia hungarica]